MRHRQTHPGLDVEGCFACKASSVMVAPSATPTRNDGARAADVNRTEDCWQRDMPAYRRLRADGLQPRGIDGCGDLEARAADPLEVTMGHVFESRDQLNEAREGMAVARELNLTGDAA